MDGSSSSSQVLKVVSQRRVSSPLIAQQIWDAINNICYQRQQPNVERIARYMSRIHGVSEEEVKRQLVHCEQDGLLKHITRTGCKGKTTGLEQDVYSIPTVLEEARDGHDWYCFVCQGGGDVICCGSCHRVYHAACIPVGLDLLSSNAFRCGTCISCVTKELQFEESYEEMNQLLVYACARLKERVPVSLTERQVPSKCSNVSGDRALTSKSTPGGPGGNNLTWVLQDDQKWRAEFLLFQTMDIISMEKKACNKEYRSFAEFEADAATVVHNVIIYHGANSSMADLVRQMLTDCKYDINEMRNCKDCYRRSNETTATKLWFCLPCNPPHMLVFAKQKGYQFWPAKVIKMDGDKYDVRFFGGPHERATLDKNFIRPITEDVSSLGIKKSTTWNKAYDELRKHQHMLIKKRANDSENGSPVPKKVKVVPLKGGRKSESGGKTPSPEKQQSSKQKGRKESRPLPTLMPTLHFKRQDTTDESSDDEDKSVSSTSLPSQPTKEAGEEDLVSSSCTEPRSKSIGLQTPQKLLKEDATRGKRRQLGDTEKIAIALEKAKKEWDKEKMCACSALVRQHEREVEKLQADHAMEITQIQDMHTLALQDCKRKQWCYNCEAEAIYHCCWNTSYCSLECQQSHWHKEHKRNCRRKR